MIKTPAADEIEGALGAIVRFNTRRPLDRRRDLLSVSADAQYAERADEWTPNLNFLGSVQTETAEGTRLGALFNFTHKGRRLRQDFLDVRFDVERDTVAAYAKANFGFDLAGVSAFGNFGLRYVNTDRSATGSTTSDNINFDQQTVDLSYDNWLPSFNLVAELGGGYYARFGAAKTMARPRLIDIAPLLNLQPFRRGGDGGNPLLRAEEVFQLDASFEKYFSRSNLVSVAFFYKDFSERIEDGVTLGCFILGDLTDDDPTDGCPTGQDIFSVNSKVNAGEAKVKGVEVAWQQSLDFLPSPLDGFGFIANYTYIDAGDASLSPSGLRLPVQDLSEHSYNLIGYYEKGSFSTRVAYNWRSEFYDEKSDANIGSFAEPHGQPDASMSFDISANFSVQAEAINILNEAEIRYQEIRERLLACRVNDRRFLIGVRWKM